MPKRTLLSALPLRQTALLVLLLSARPANAQQEYYEGSITYADRNGKQVWLHNEKPLQGLCKINFMDIDFAARYTLSTFRDGVQGDTVSYYTARTNQLTLTEIRLGENARRICDYLLYNGSFMREWTEVDGQRDGPLKEWYAEGKQRLEEVYKAGKRDGMSRTWDQSGRLTSQERYRRDRLDGKAEKWNYEGADRGELEIAYHQQDDRPYMIERFAFADGRQGLIERTIPDSDGTTLYSARKSDCDSTRIDTLYSGRMTVEIRDFREGRIRSLERYDPTHFYGFLVPDGVFELYGPDERVGTRILYEGGRQIISRDYFEEEPRTDVRTTLLSRADGDRLLTASCDSKHFDKCDETRPLRILSQTGEVLFESDEAERRYEYHGYDPSLKLHVGFSSIGSWNDIRWYAVYEGDGAETNLELPEELFAVNGTTGLIASGISFFDGEQDLTVYRRIEDEDAGSYFEVVFWITLTEVPEAVWGLHWIGDNSLLLLMDKSCLRVDIAPESLERHEDERGCP